MFILKKILSSFLMPPGIFIILLLIAGIRFLFKKNLKAGIISILTGSLLWVFSIAPVSDYLLYSLERNYAIPKNAKGDVIILLGGGIYESAPDMSGAGAPTEHMSARIITAVRLQKKLGIPVIISGGSVFKGRKAEAPVVRRFLTDLGVPVDKIIVEDKSRDTNENAKYTEMILTEYGYKKPLLVTSAYHMKRSLISFKKAGINALPFPAGFKTWENRKYGWYDYLPGGFGNTSIAMHEYLGLLFYRIAY